LNDLVARWAPIDAVGVRFVHGGDRVEAAFLDGKEIARLRALTLLAPLHQPLALALTELVERVLRVPVVACFDTAFHAQLPAAAAHYALPQAWVRDYGLRRYGFHGLSCAHALYRAAELLHRERRGLNLLCCHLGSGVSVTAIRDGHSVDTSMGFTPLEGTVMATRSGTVDPGLLLYLLRTGVTDVAGMEQALDRRSGLAGMTGTSGDVREVLAARAAGDRDATVAIEVYLHRLRREMAAATVSLDRLDAIVLTGGVAEHQPELMADLVTGVPILGAPVDRSRLRGQEDRVISPPEAAVRVLVVTAREHLEMARQVTDVCSQERLSHIG